MKIIKAHITCWLIRLAIWIMPPKTIAHSSAWREDVFEAKENMRNALDIMRRFT
jgi:hypothetical protein